jgi:hypothetical protein
MRAMRSFTGKMALSVVAFAAAPAAAAGCSSTGAGSDGGAVVDAGSCPLGVSDPNSTAAVFSRQGPDCLPCAINAGCLDPNQGGGCCEIVSGNAASGAQTESALCFKTLNDIFSTMCASRLLDPAPCFCGTDNVSCLDDDAAVPMGPLVADYQADFGNDPSATVANFEATNFGSSQANNIVNCAALYGCQCFGSTGLDFGGGDTTPGVSDEGGGD